MKSIFLALAVLLLSLTLCSRALTWTGTVIYSHDAEGRLEKVGYKYLNYQLFSYAPNGSLVHEYMTASGDTDNDQLPDSWEMEKFTDLSHHYSGDDDSDGLTNQLEYLYGTEPLNDDTDGDGATDGDEVDADTDPLNQDSDTDGMLDGWELDNGLNALEDDTLEDPDGDDWTNIQEYNAGTDPNDPDSYPSAIVSPWITILLNEDSVPTRSLPQEPVIYLGE